MDVLFEIFSKIDIVSEELDTVLRKIRESQMNVVGLRCMIDQV